MLVVSSNVEEPCSHDVVIPRLSRMVFATKVSSAPYMPNSGIASFLSTKLPTSFSLLTSLRPPTDSHRGVPDVLRNSNIADPYCLLANYRLQGRGHL